jgi:hypothetical protein
MESRLTGRRDVGGEPGLHCRQIFWVVGMTAKIKTKQEKRATTKAGRSPLRRAGMLLPTGKEKAGEVPRLRSG